MLGGVGIIQCWVACWGLSCLVEVLGFEGFVVFGFVRVVCVSLGLVGLWVCI